MRDQLQQGKFRRWLRRLLLVILLAPLLLWGLLSLLFTTSWGTGMISSRVEKKLGLACEIDRLGWVPWSGFFVKDLVLSAPEDFSPACEVVRLDSIKITPRWQDILRKRLGVKELTVDGIEVEMPVELLRHLSKKSQTPPLVLADQAAPEPAKHSLAESPQSHSPASPADVPNQEKRPPSSLPPSPSPPPPSSVKTPVAVHSQISIENASVRIYSIEHPRLEFSTFDVSADFPLGGEVASGQCEIGSVTAGGGELFRDLTFPLNWNGNTLALTPQELETRGFKFSLSAAFRPVHGLPFGVLVNVPEQPVSLSEVLQTDLPVSIGTFAARNQLNAYLLYPHLLSGSSLSTYRDLLVQSSDAETPIVFDWGQAQFQLTPAGLISRDFRWIGEDEAILGNGYLTKAGTGVVITRIVTSEQRVEMYERRAREFRNDFSLRMRPLITPDRWYSDVRLDLAKTGLTLSLEEEEPSPKIFP